MNIDIESRPSYGMAVVTLDKGEQITAESGAMVAMSSGLRVDTTFNGTGSGGVFDWLQAALTGLIRKYMAGETLFVNNFRSTGDGQQVMLAPAMVGDVEQYKVSGENRITVQATSYLASTKGVRIDLIWAGFSMLFSKEGAFFLRCRGEGDVLINSYGAIEKVEIDGRYIVDTGHVVGFSGDLKYKIRRVGGWKATILSGEGLVLEFSGKGSLWLQTRNINAMVSWITPVLPA
jgi:uncharacterized protein (TIGR00266 family)